MGMMGRGGDVPEADEEGREMGRVVGACWWSKPGMVAKAARGAVRAGGRSQWRPEPVVAEAWWPEPWFYSALWRTIAWSAPSMLRMSHTRVRMLRHCIVSTECDVCARP